MPRLRAGLGIVAGVLLLLSSAAHSFLGWAGLGKELVAAGVPPGLVFGVKVGWQFGGACMLAFAVIVLATFVGRLRGCSTSAVPALVIGVTELAFGIWALVASDFQPFFLVFIVPGILLLSAGWGQRPGAMVGSND
jgi:hypothetical protein